MIRLDCKVQKYDWGKPGLSSKVAQLASANGTLQVDQQTKYAELWMGTHPNAPSSLSNKDSDGTTTLLQSILSPKTLHPSVATRFHNQLPFLFKVLSIAKALSIQAHPDKKLAEELFAKRPDLYKDDNHKPEMAVALTDFEGLCGFKPLEEIALALTNYPEFAAVIGQGAADAFQNGVKSKSLDTQKHALRDLFKQLMEADVALVKKQLEALVDRLAKDPATNKQGTIPELIVRLNKQFPGDVGCFCVLILNYMSLKPGEGFFMAANDPHAYLFGDCIECMATSDNVVRAGLTPKAKDVKTLVNMLTYQFGPPTKVQPQPYVFKGASTAHTLIFDPPIPEFAIMQTILPARSTVAHFEPIPGPSIIVVIEGAAEVTSTFDSLKEATPVAAGHVYFVPAQVALEMEASGCGVTLYRAFCQV